MVKDDLESPSSSTTGLQTGLGYVNTKHFTPTGGLGRLSDDTDSLAGSFYDSNRIVPMPDDEELGAMRGIGEDENNNNASQVPNPLDSSIANLDLNQSNGNIQLALNDEEERERYEQERDSLIEQQQKELEQEQIEEYKRLVASKEAALKAKQDRDLKMAAGVRAIESFLSKLGAKLEEEDSTINISETTETALYAALATMQELSEQVNYDNNGAI